MKTKTFYLFGTDAVREFQESQDSKAVAKIIRNSGGQLYSIGLYDHSSELLSAYDGWNDFIELSEEIPFVDFTAKIQRIKINDDTLTIVLDWTNQSEYEQAHFGLLAGIDVYQGDDILEMTKGEERLLKQIKKDSFDVVDLEYKLEDNKTPIKITFIPWNEYDEKKELTIEIN